MEIKEFLNKSYTCYHAAELGAKMLNGCGFADIDAPKKGKPVGFYRVTGGCLFAARAGGEKLNIALSHTDSPSLRVRYRGGAFTGSPVTLETEKYGGGLLRSYLDRKMKIAGRVIMQNNGILESKNVCSDFNVVIPSLAVHLGAGKDGETLTVLKDMRPLLGSCADLYAALGVSGAADSDLYCVPADEAFISGAQDEYLCSPRIDNLVSVYASVKALIDCKSKSTAVVACFNSEETGSETREGAQSALIKRFIRDLFDITGISADIEKSLLRSFALSCDGAHALNPNRKEVYSPDAPALGGGIVIKRNDRYATDALTAATTREIFYRAGVKTQVYYHHPDMRCGSTIGLTAAHTLGCAVCDIGVAQLSMHSACETAALSDISNLTAGLTEFFGSEITVTNNKTEIK